MNTIDQEPGTAIVTGAGRGFGREVAAALVDAGWRVVGLARTAADLAQVREELGDRFTPMSADAVDEAVARSAISEYQPSLLVLNAGATPHMAPLTEHT